MKKGLKVKRSKGRKVEKSKGEHRTSNPPSSNGYGVASIERRKKGKVKRPTTEKGVAV